MYSTAFYLTLEPKLLDNRVEQTHYQADIAIILSDGTMQGGIWPMGGTNSRPKCSEPPPLFIVK